MQKYIAKGYLCTNKKNTRMSRMRYSDMGVGILAVVLWEDKVNCRTKCWPKYHSWPVGEKPPLNFKVFRINTHSRAFFSFSFFQKEITKSLCFLFIVPSSPTSFFFLTLKKQYINWAVFWFNDGGILGSLLPHFKFFDSAEFF